MDRSGVRRLLGIEPARIHIVDAEVSATGPWEGISLSRVLLRASDGHTIPCLLQEPEHLSTPLPVVAIHSTTTSSTSKGSQRSPRTGP